MSENPEGAVRKAVKTATKRAGKKATKKAAKKAAIKAARRAALSQSDVPGYSLKAALRVPQAIADHYAKQPTSPLDLAIAMDMSPNSGPFRMLTGAAVAYGLTEGAAWAETIGLTELGRRIVAPTVEGDDEAAQQDAVLRPRVISEFLTKYDGHPLPKKNIALNVLEQMGVQPDATERAYDMIMENAQDLGLVREHKGKAYVRLSAAGQVDTPAVVPPDADSDDPLVDSEIERGATPEEPVTVDTVDLTQNKRVFITHGKNRKIVDQLKELLTFGDMEPVVSVEKETVAKPVSDKVLDEMRSCGAAIVHVGTEMRLLDEKGDEHIVLNPNVLIEIGAAMALYERRFILLVEKGVALPSNLQGLYEVRYEGDRLDYDATMKLLRAFTEFKAPPATS